MASWLAGFKPCVELSWIAKVVLDHEAMQHCARSLTRHHAHMQMPPSPSSSTARWASSSSVPKPSWNTQSSSTRYLMEVPELSRVIVAAHAVLKCYVSPCAGGCAPQGQHRQDAPGGSMRADRVLCWATPLQVLQPRHGGNFRGEPGQVFMPNCGKAFIDYGERQPSQGAARSIWGSLLMP